MQKCFVLNNNERDQKPIPIIALTSETLEHWLLEQSGTTKNWITQSGFTAKPDSICCVPDTAGNIREVLIGMRDAFSFGILPLQLPAGVYYLAKWQPEAALAWGLGAYQYHRYKSSAIKTPATLLLPAGIDHENLFALLDATYLIRDLINTPAEDMGPDALAEIAENLARKYQAEFKQIMGADLLAANYPAVYAVGRAAAKPPRLIDLRWGDKNLPKITLVGKGVCFDSGGLNIKVGNSMLSMKKDMGGAAHVLGLAQLIMHHKLPVCLRVLIPAVENAISGNAYRPGDIIKTRSGLSVEITNTDAEGRVVLADALTEAVSEQPELLIDFATLTGAARIAVGTEIAAFFTDSERLAAELSVCAEQQRDPLWRLPLYAPYQKLLDSNIADMSNASGSPYAGAITAALFLQRFVNNHNISWLHFDIMAANASTSPARPEGGEAMGLRAVFAYLQQQFGLKK